MIYLDYAANTPVEDCVLDSFVSASKSYIANPNSVHLLGRQAKTRMEEASAKIAATLGVKPSEVIYTSGASEANNLAIKGIARAYREYGKHIISTGLEHSAVSGALTYLQSLGYEIDLLDITSDGTVDLMHLKELLRKDTILVSIGYVDSELGVKQPIKEIGEILKEYKNCYFHTDATQAVGKIPLELEYVDLLSFAPHKFYGLNGSGVLVKKEGVILEPLIHGGASTSIYRSGTPVLPMAVATETALVHAYENMEKNFQYVKELNEYMRSQIAAIKEVRINSTKESIPYTLNMSAKGIKAEAMRSALEEEGFAVSTKSACSVPNTPSRAVYAVSKDRKNAMSSFRVSLSYMTTKEEVVSFIEALTRCISRLAK